MKNYFGYKFLAVLLTVGVMFTACVDDEVAPEVSALRQAQVDLMQSKTAMQDLQNAAQEILNNFNEAMNALKLQSEQNKIAQQEMALTHQEALNALEILRITDQDAYMAAMNALNLQDHEADLAYEEAIRALNLLQQTQQNAYENAMDSIQVERMQLQLAEDLAWFDVQAKKYEMELVEAEKDLEVALADMAKYIAESGLEDAQEYIDKYGWAMQDYYSLVQQVITKQTDIAQMGLALGENPDVTGNFAAYAEMVQKQIDEDTDKLTALQTLLADLKAVATDPTAAETALAAAKVKVQSLVNANEQLEVDRVKHQQDVVDVAQEALAQAVGGYSPVLGYYIPGTINDYNNAQYNIENLKNWIEDDEQSIEMYKGYIENNETSIARYEGELVTREAILATNTAEYEKQKALRDDADDVRNAAEEALATAQNEMDLAGIANQALWNAFNQANSKYWDAQYAFWNAEGELSNAEQNLANANDYYEANYTNFETELENAETAEATALTALNTAQAAFDASPTNANLTALENARSDYNAAMSTTAMWQSNIEWLEDWLSDAQAALPEAKAALATATSNLDAAKAEKEAAATAYYEVGTPAQQEAQEAFNQAEQNYWTVNQKFWDQYWLTRNVEDLMDAAQYEVDWRKNSIEYMESNIEYNNKRIAMYEKDIANNEQEIANNEAIISELQTAYDALTPEAIASLRDALDKAWVDNDELYMQIRANQEMIYAQNHLIWVLQDQLNNINAQVAQVEIQVEDLMDGIAQMEEALADNDIDKAEAMALLELEKEKLALLITKRDAAMELANKWMGLYEAAIAE